MAPVIGAGAPETDMQIRYTAMPEQERPTENTSDNIPVMENDTISELEPETMSGLQSNTANYEPDTKVIEPTPESPSSMNENKEDVYTLKRFAEDTGLGENGTKAIYEAYNNSGVPIPDYAAAFTAYYNAGRDGRTIEDVKTRYSEGATGIQKRVAFNAGRLDALQSGNGTVENNSDKPYTEIKTAEDIADRLMESSDITADGHRYTITGIADGYIGRIDNVYTSRPFKTREEAVYDVSSEAENRFYPKEVNGNGRYVQSGLGRGQRGLRERELGEVSDGEGIPVASALGQGSSGVLDGVSSEYVPGNAERRDAAEEPYEGGKLWRSTRRNWYTAVWH